MGASKDFPGEKIGKFQIVQELRGSRHDLFAVSPLYGFSYIAIIFAQNLSPFLGNRPYCFKDMVVTHAAAEVA